MFVKLSSIKQKMFFAFSLVLSAALLSAFIAHLAFVKLTESMERIAGQSVPIMAESMEVTQLGTELSSLLPGLTSATTLEQKDNIADKVNKAQIKLEQMLLVSNIASDSVQIVDQTSDFAEPNKTNVPDDAAFKVAFLTEQRENIEEIERQVTHRIDSENKTESLIGTLSNVQHTLDKDLQKIIKGMKNDFVSLADDAYDKNGELIDEVLEVHLESMFNALRFKVQVSEVIAIILNTLSVNTNDQLEQDAKSIRISLKIMDLYRNMLLIEPSSKLEKLDIDLNRIRDIASATSGIYSRPFAILNSKKRKELGTNIRNLQIQINQLLDPEVDSSYSMIFLTASQLNSNVTKALPELINTGLGKLVDMVQLRAEINTMAGLLAQIPQASSQAIQPLFDRYLETKKAVDKLSTALIDVNEFDKVKFGIQKLVEIANNENGLFFLRKNSLETQLAITTMNQKLSNDQSEFVARLAEDVRENRARISSAGEEFIRLIRRSRLQLAIVSVFGILFTGLVFWMLVSRNMISRLLQIIKALKSLADGDTNVAVHSAGNDEISDLASTVGVFRDRAIESIRLQDEQRLLEKEKSERECKLREAEKNQREAEVERHRIEQQQSHETQRSSEELQLRVDKLLAAVNAASNGNLNYPLDVMGDDLAGQMGKALDKLFSELRTSMTSISDNASLLSNASESLTHLSEDMNQMAMSNAEDSEKASILANNVETNVSSVAESTTQINSSINDVAQSSSEAKDVALEAVNLAQKTDSTVRKLAMSSAGIGSVIKDITSIAEQTNLLALNATIEAARAGDAGKGFAVVANEVKELAKETATATEKIEARIGEIQTDTASAVDAISSISEIIGRINEIQSTIAQAISEQTVVTNGITHHIEQTSSGTEAISSVISIVANKASLNQQASSDLSGAAVDLSNMSKHLQKLVGRFSLAHSEDKSSVV